MSRPHDGQGNHQQVWELLAWYVNGRATPEQRRVVERHLPHCEACRAEHAAQRQLHACMSDDTAAVPDPAPGLARLLRDIERPAGAQAGPARRGMGRRLQLAVAGLGAIVLLESATLAALGLQRAEYHTLSSAGPANAQATIRLVPAPSMRLGELQQQLLRFELQVVGGPTEAGVYSLAPSGRRVDTARALAGLRATPGVLFAEPVEAAK